MSVIEYSNMMYVDCPQGSRNNFPLLSMCCEAAVFGVEYQRKTLQRGRPEK